MTFYTSSNVLGSSLRKECQEQTLGGKGKYKVCGYQLDPVYTVQGHSKLFRGGAAEVTCISTQHIGGSGVMAPKKNLFLRDSF